MSWMKFDDRLLDHPKFVRAERLAGSTALHLWMGLVSYCKQHRTDGYVPIDMLPMVNGPGVRWRQRALDALLEVVLVEREGDRLHVHDYLDWNASRYEIEHSRKRSEPPAESGVSVGGASEERTTSVGGASEERRRSVGGAQSGSNDNGYLGVGRLRARSESESESESESIKRSPLPPNGATGEPTASSKKKSSTRTTTRICPADFEPNAAVLKLATELGYSAALEQATRPRMIDWSLSKSIARADWQATYRNWLRKDAEERGLKPVKHDPQRERYLEEMRRANEPVKNPVKPPAGVENKIRNLFG